MNLHIRLHLEVFVQKQNSEIAHTQKRLWWQLFGNACNLAPHRCFVEPAECIDLDFGTNATLDLSYTVLRGYFDNFENKGTFRSLEACSELWT